MHHQQRDMWIITTGHTLVLGQLCEVLRKVGRTTNVSVFHMVEYHSQVRFFYLFIKVFWQLSGLCGLFSSILRGKARWIYIVSVAMVLTNMVSRGRGVK